MFFLAIRLLHWRLILILVMVLVVLVMVLGLVVLVIYLVDVLTLVVVGGGCGGAGLSRNDGGLRVLGRPCGCVSGIYDGGGGVVTLVPCVCWRLFAFAGGCLCGGWLFGGGGCDGGGGGGGAGACCGSGGGSQLWKWWPWYITS